jgi:3-methylcrotonyl-CoA carboxylase alpha subunit
MSFCIVLNGIKRHVDIVQRRPHLVVSVDGRCHIVEDSGNDNDGIQSVCIGGNRMTLARAGTRTGQVLRVNNRTYTADLLVDGENDSSDIASEVRAPMPGAVIAVDVQLGANVLAGDSLMTIESMKLQTVMTAPRAGIIAEVLVADGDSFDKDQILIRLEEEVASHA